MALKGQRVLPDEQILVARETDHEVAGAEAHQPGIGGHADERGVEMGARLGVPARVERRVKAADAG